MSRRTVRFAVWASAAWLLAQSPASATTMPPPIVFTAPSPDEPSPLAVLGEQLVVTCEEGSEPRCFVVARYTYRNDGSQPERLSLRVDSGWESVVRTDGRLGRIADGSIPTFTIAAGSDVMVELRGEFTLFQARPNLVYLTSALVTRHPVFGTDPTEPYRPSYWFARSNRELFLGGIGSAELSASASPGWQVGSAVNIDPRLSPIFTETFDTREDIGILFARELGAVQNGGPFVGLGGTFHRGVHGRLGYEFGFHPLLLSSLTLETDFQEEFVVAPLFEAALPTIVWLPSLGLGFGVPIRLIPEVQPGIRVQLTASFYASFVTSFDYFPGTDESVRVTLLGQFGL